MPDGARTEEYWQNGHLQRDQGPARIRYSAGGVITRSEWHQLAVGAAASRCHREDGPAVLADDPVLGTHTEEYYVGGQRHREDGPAYSLIADNGYSNSSYYRNGELHREDGPAVSTVDSESDFGTEGSVTEEWYREGQLHREDGPAQITTFTKGARTECYYLRGLKHREDGPASIKYRENGTIAYQLWFRGGKPQSSSRWHRFSAGFLGAKSIPRASRQRR